MTDSQLQSALNGAFNKVLEDWAMDDLETEIPLQVALNAFDDAKSDAPTVLAAAREAARALNEDGE